MPLSSAINPPQSVRLTIFLVSEVSMYWIGSFLTWKPRIDVSSFLSCTRLENTAKLLSQLIVKPELFVNFVSTSWSVRLDLLEARYERKMALDDVATDGVQFYLERLAWISNRWLKRIVEGVAPFFGWMIVVGKPSTRVDIDVEATHDITSCRKVSSIPCNSNVLSIAFHCKLSNTFEKSIVI